MKTIDKLCSEVDNLNIKDNPAKIYPYKKNISPKIRKALEDLDLNHNSSWAVEMFNRNRNNLDHVAIFYRGTKITYKELFEKAYKYACSLKQMGYKKGDEIPVCVGNIPEFVYLMLAISFIGAKINSFGEWFDKDYNVEILNSTNSKTVFVSDDVYNDIKEKIDKSNIENIVVMSLANSLHKDENGKEVDPYEEIDKLHYNIVNKTDDIRKGSSKSVISCDEFENMGKGYDLNAVEKVSINDPFAITYTSGTTDPGKPKAVLHSNRSYITLSRFKESDVSGMPSMRNLSVLCHIPTYTHMELSCALSDTLFEGCTLALEPFYTREFFPYALIMNKPNFVPAGVGFWNYLCNKLNSDERFKHIKMPYLLIPTITGEGASAGEEKYFNYTARKHKFGTGKLPFPVTFSIGGGTTESSGIFVTLYKALQEKKPSNLIKKNSLGLTPHKFVEIEVLNNEGDYCKIGEPGLLVANSPCTMMKYLYNDELNKNTHVTDKYGKTWLSLGTYSYKSDEKDRIKMKGRLSDYIVVHDGIIPQYLIEDTVLKDTKNIKSCSIVKVSQDGINGLVCHIEFAFNCKKSQEEILSSMAQRLTNVLPEEVLNQLYFKVRSGEDSYPLAPSGKRNYEALKAEGIDKKTFKINDILYPNKSIGYTLKKSK